MAIVPPLKLADFASLNDTPPHVPVTTKFVLRPSNQREPHGDFPREIGHCDPALISLDPKYDAFQFFARCYAELVLGGRAILLESPVYIWQSPLYVPGGRMATKQERLRWFRENPNRGRPAKDYTIFVTRLQRIECSLDSEVITPGRSRSFAR